MSGAGQAEVAIVALQDNPAGVELVQQLAQLSISEQGKYRRGQVKRCRCCERGAQLIVHAVIADVLEDLHLVSTLPVPSFVYPDECGMSWCPAKLIDAQTNEALWLFMNSPLYTTAVNLEMFSAGAPALLGQVFFRLVGALPCKRRHFAEEIERTMRCRARGFEIPRSNRLPPIPHHHKPK